MIDPRQYEAFKRFVADYSIVVKGELEAEYKKVAGLIAEWDKRNDYGKLYAELQQGQADLIAKTEAQEKNHAQRTSKLQAWEDGLKKREQDLEARLKEHADASGALRAAQIAHSTTVAATKAALDQTKSELEGKAKVLSDFQEILHKRDLELGKKETKVQQVLSQMNETLKG